MSESSTPRLVDSLQLFVDIVRFRKGPEDLPVSRGLLLGAVAGSAVMQAAMLVIQPLNVVASPVVVVGLQVGLMLTLLMLLLNIVHRPERFLQTAAAVFGMHIVLAPLLLFSGWFFLAYISDPVLQLPATLLRLGVEVWTLAVMGRILRSATDLPLFACVMFAITSVLLTHLAIAALFPAVESTPVPV